MSDIHIEVTDYDPEWPSRFEQEAARMYEMISNHVITIEHIGSTSVPGLAAKPVIDICLVVSDMEEGAVCANLLHEADYYRADAERPDDWIQLGRIADDGQQFNIHIRPEDSENLENYLLLRDYLCDHPDERERYANVKRAAAEEYTTDISGYTRQKSDVIGDILDKARDAGYETSF